jgi:hypothetical protein
MPSIVGYASNLNTSAAATSFTLPSPASEPNDLFLAIIAVDTGSGVWTSPGWTLLSARTNTTQLAVMYKISSGSTEADEFTFTTTVAETFHGRIISIREVNTSTPFGSTALYKMDSQAAASKYQMPSISTTVNNALLIYANSSSAVGVPSIIEGPVTLLCGEDGSAEASGVGWSFKTRSGTTPTNVTSSFVGTGTGIKMVLQIAPPTSGATQIPAFCALDNSIYVDPINGTTAFNGNAALSATFDTNFATTISGVTAADASWAAADINSYHSAGRVTSISASKNWAGVALDLAVGNNINVTGKNVLVHTGPSTPGQIQNIGPIAAQKGIIFGMRSTASNWKVWHVHGRGTPFGYQRDVPLIINSSNTSGLLHTTGTFNAAATDIFGFAVAGGGVSTTIWDFYSLWVLDSTIICGGSSTTPVKIPGIVSAAADGHERKSIVQQGAAQAIIYQPIILGSGGTEPIYLDLDATAIEFPRQYSLANSQVNYCSVDGVAGLTYWAGNGDTIKHRNSVISSPSPYHWGFHSGSSISTATTYDFSGLQIIGAKPINTKSGITLNSTIFNGCGTFNLSGMVLTNCTFASSIDTVALRVGTDGAFSGVTGCIFENNTRAIEFISAGTYNMDGCTFENNTVDIWNSSSGAVIINALNGSNPISTLNSGGGSITINNSKSLTITGLQADSEVRVYDASSSVELAGVENSTDTFTYNYNYTGDTLTNIVIHHLDYQYILLEGIILGSDGVSIPVQQQTDRNYLNPA